MVYGLEDEDFKYISKRVYEYCGINLTEKKKGLIKTRLTKRINALKLNSISDYTKYLKKNDPDNKEFQYMIDALSTNFSNFFRENNHFLFLQSNVLPMYKNKKINIWSAASSTGQEIYSILITILEFKKSVSYDLLYNLYASDISRNVLHKAANGVFNRDDIKILEKKVLKEYFLQGVGDKSHLVKIKKKYTNQINFFRANLNQSPFNIPAMDVIFLRNVMIYFDEITKIDIVERLLNYLKIGGYLIIGHSESLNGISDKVRHLGDSIYIKERL